MTRVVVTGSAGYVGRHVTATLRGAGILVTGFDLRDGADMADRRALDAAAHGVDAVVHLALAPTVEANLDGLDNVLDVAAGRRVVLLSSTRVLGTRPQYLPIDDDHPAVPDDGDAYASVKLTVERRACDAGALCIRAPLVVETPGGPLPRWELGAWIAASDLGAAVVAAVAADVTGVITVVADDISTRDDTARRLATRHHPDVPWRAGDDADDPYRALVRTTRAREVLGWAPRLRWSGPGLL